MACESACTLQLLLMHGLAELPIDTAAYDLRIGRTPGEGDFESGNLRVQLESGFEIRQYSNIDLQMIVSSSDYVRQGWIDEGDDPAEVDEILPSVYPQLRKRIQKKIDIIGRFPETYHRIPRDSNWTDIVLMLKDCYIVGCDYQSNAGTSHRILITRELADDEYEIYEPSVGVERRKGVEDLAVNLLPGAEGYRLSA